MSRPSILDFSWTSPIISNNEQKDVQDTSLGKILDRFHSQDIGVLLVKSGWHDRSGALEDSDEEEALMLEDETPAFYAKAYEAFKQGQNMPSRLRRSEHALQDTPFEMKKAGIELRPAQLEGAGLLCWLEKKYGLGILADDMGVGKTFQLMALMFQNKPSGAEKTTLLVVPAGAIDMWKTNLETFKEITYIEFKSYYLHSLTVEELSKHDVVLTTYGLISNQYIAYADKELDIKASVDGQVSRRVKIGTGNYVRRILDTRRPWAPLFGMMFHRVILDEAHRIRNTKSAGFKAMSHVQTHSRIACSGTIFNNDYTDIGAILTFLRYQPWCNPSSFTRYFLKAKRKKSGRGGGRANRAQLKHLRGAIFKYTLDGISIRRTKMETFEGKQIINVEALDFQRREHSLDDEKPYIKYQGRGCTELETQEDTKDLWVRGPASDDEVNLYNGRLPEILFARLTCTSQLCPDAGYSNRGLEDESELDVDIDYYGDQRDIEPVKKDVSAFIDARNKLRKMARDGWAKSTKLREAVRRICDHLAQNVDVVAPAKLHKIVVYCEFLSTLDVLEVGLELTCPNQPILRLDGQSSSTSRSEAISNFMQVREYCIMLITTNAGSEAIDLSAADYVLFLHPIWNPAQVQQCIGRVYRHGQEQQVKARILVAKDSIESYVYRIQAQKRKKDLLLKSAFDEKTMNQVHAIQDEVEFTGKLAKIRVGFKAQRPPKSTASQALQVPAADSDSDVQGGTPSDVQGGTPSDVQGGTQSDVQSGAQSGAQSGGDLMDTDEGNGNDEPLIPREESSSEEEEESDSENMVIETEVTGP